jgi:hypothetical protein
MSRSKNSEVEDTVGSNARTVILVTGEDNDVSIAEYPFKGQQKMSRLKKLSICKCLKHEMYVR